MVNNGPRAKRRRITRAGPSDNEQNIPGPSTQIEDVPQIGRIERRQGINEKNVSGPSNQMSESSALFIGRIERVHLINFMCHANYVVEFNKNINVFVGCNGSGKSAIITAVVIGLGGKAAAAERSKNIAQLIRRGQPSASIEITLHNSGEDSYENEKYGNRIIVHRQINSNGASQYRIKNEMGAVVTVSLRDLQKILMYMNIQVDNPICVLNQDAARSFLKEADPRKRYLLFSKATQLEKIIEIFNESAQSYRVSTAKLGIMEKNLETQIKKYKEYKDHYERLMSVETFKEKLRNLKIELEWTKVREEEMKCAAIANKLVEINEKIGELKGSIASWSEDMRKLKEEKANLIIEVTQAKTIITTNRSDHDSFRASLIERRSQLDQQETKHKNLITKLKRLQKDINEMQKSIDDRQTSNRGEILRRENEEKLQILLAKRDENRSVEGNLRTNVEILDRKAEEAKTVLEDLNHRHRDAKQNMDKILDEIKGIDVRSTNNLSIFGNHMPKLIAAIEKHHNEGHFTELPRGPIGRYVQVRNEKWSRLVEHILGGQLRYFIFNTHEDSKFFDNLMKREFSKINTNISKIVTKFCHTPHDVRKNKVKVQRGSATLLLDEISVSDPVVLNVLIDQVHIEAILMCSSTAEACQYTTEERNVPTNLLKIFSLDPTAEYYPAPNFRSYGMNVSPSRLLQADMLQYKLQLEQELTIATTEFEAIQGEFNNSKQIVKHSQDQLSEKKKNLLKIEQKLSQLQNQIEEIENFEYPVQHEVEVLQNELKELQNAYETTNVGLENVKQDSHTLKQQVQAVEQDIKVNKQEAKKLENSVKEKTNQIGKITEKIDNLAVNNVEADLKRYEADKKKNVIEESKQQKILESITQSASEKGERIEQNRDAAKIQILIKSTENKIQKRYGSTDDITTVRKLMDEWEKIYKTTDANIEVLNNVLKDLNTATEARYEWLFHAFRPHVSLKISTKFSRILMSRKFGGEMRIQHAHKTLDIEVVPRDKNIADAVSNTKSLSGGERSFSTLALLTSLWSCVSSPFYFLDEYDVFTDQINRRFMTQLLISEAKLKPDRQFCFFTPQDMSFIEESDAITFHRIESHLRSE